MLLALPFILFWRVWWPDSAQRRVFAYGDFVEQHYPMRTFVASELRAGRLPLWDPYTFAGEPAVADSLFAAYYPLGLWQVVFPDRLPFWALQVEAIFHLGLAGLFTCLFVRQLTRRLGAGLIAGAAFSLSGFLTSYPMLQLIILETATWLPAGLWLTERALSRRSLRGVALAGLILSWGVLAGHFQTFLYMAYAVLGYFAFRAVQETLRRRFAMAQGEGDNYTVRFFSLAGLILAGAIVGGSAAQWLPSLQIAGLSPHANVSYEYLSPGFQPAELWGALRPNIGQWSPLYVGWVALALSVVSLGQWAVGAFSRRIGDEGAGAPTARRALGGQTVFWAVVALLALALSLGRNGFLYPLAYRLAPGFALFRQQERAALLVTFALCILAGLGFAAMADWRRWFRLALPVLMGLLFFDLYRANAGVILQAPPAGGYLAPTQALQYLNNVRDITWRVSTESLLPCDGNAGLVFRLRDVIGSAPLYLASFDRFIERVPEARWWQMLDVDHLVTRRRIDHAGARLILEDGEQRLYQLFLGGQPSWIVHQVYLAADATASIDRTAAPDFDPFTIVALERSPDPQPAPASGPESARVSHFANQRIDAEVSLSAPGVVVFSEVFYPGWVARVNGRDTPALRAYGLLRAIALPAGDWRIEWRYEPAIAYAGIGVTVLIALLVVIWQLTALRQSCIMKWTADGDRAHVARLLG